MQDDRWRRPRKDRLKRQRRRRLIVLLAGLALIAYGLIRLIGYGVDWVSARRAVREMRKLYYASATDEPVLFTETPAVTPSATPEPTDTPEPTFTPEPTPVPTPTQSPIPRLESGGYPSNPQLKISTRFKQLRQVSKYIVGWLTLDRLIDEPVVQRDNTFYLDHDVNGDHNVNGAIFMEMGINLKKQPHSYLLYGHNMKTGAMFGSLRNFENPAYYHASPFITFDTMFENGRYVIFAAGSVSTEKSDPNYVDFYNFLSSVIQDRQDAIDSLKAVSVHTCTVDVQPEDQLLILVTCVERNVERRIVAARRIRADESEDQLKALVNMSQTK